jgi:CubicO group peptidase (beta-lactamase class C family)
MSTKANALEICGQVSPGFEPVREQFRMNFTKRGELGGACSIFYRGKQVVDLWGGVRNKSTGEPWEEGTMVIVFSTTKGLAAMTIALLHSRGKLDYEEKVSKYWPEFAQAGKQGITVRQLLSHQAGLCVIDEPITRETLADPDALAAALARQKPAWIPGTRQGYHAISIGFYESELVRRIDAAHRRLGQFFQEEIAAPLGLDFYIGLPEEMNDSRLATIQMFQPAAMPFHLSEVPIGYALALMNRNSMTTRALFKNPGLGIPFSAQRIYTRSTEFPAMGGIGTARSIAQAYSAILTGEMGLIPETLKFLSAPPIRPTRGFHDEVLKVNWRLSLGYAKPGLSLKFGRSESSFGTPGLGGSFGFADPDEQVGYAYVTNKMGFCQGYDPRDVALRNAFYACI